MYDTGRIVAADCWILPCIGLFQPKSGDGTQPGWCVKDKRKGNFRPLIPLPAGGNDATRLWWQRNLVHTTPAGREPGLASLLLDYARRIAATGQPPILYLGWWWCGPITSLRESRVFVSQIPKTAPPAGIRSVDGTIHSLSADPIVSQEPFIKWFQEESAGLTDQQIAELHMACQEPTMLLGDACDEDTFALRDLREDEAVDQIVALNPDI